MEKSAKDALVASAAAWGEAVPQRSTKFEWEPGCVHQGHSMLWRGQTWSMRQQQARWLKLDPFYTKNPDGNVDDIHQMRVFVYLVSLLSALPGFGWRQNRDFWQEVLHRCDQASTEQLKPTHQCLEGPCIKDTEYDNDVDPRFMIDFQYTNYDVDNLERCFSFLTAATSDVLSSKLQTLVASASCETRWIAIGLCLKSLDLTTSQLVKLYVMLQAYSEYEPESSEPTRYPSVQFVITTLNLSRNKLTNPRDNEILGDILLLQSPRVAIRHLNLTRTFGPANHVDDVTAFQGFIQRVLRDDASSLEELVLGGNTDLLYEHFAAVFSAVRYSTKLKALRIEQSPAHERVHRYNYAAVWSWLALAVVHPSSQSQLRCLAIPYVTVNESATECIQRTLSSEHPGLVTFVESTTTNQNESELLPYHAGTTFVSIKRGTKLRNQPKSASHHPIHH